jgi:hypothetical protein
MEFSLVLARPFSFCTAFAKLVITPSSEVQMMHRLLGWNLDFEALLSMYDLAPVYSRVGADLVVKMRHVSCNRESCVCKPSVFGQRSWSPLCNVQHPSRNQIVKPLL